MKSKKAAAIMLCAALGASMVTGVSVSAKDKDELVLYTWDGMVPQEVLDDFEKETGTKVVYSNFDTDETMLEKLSQAKGGDYDVVIADDYIIDSAVKEGLVQKIDKDTVTNFGNINPLFQGQFYDPDDEYTVPYGAGIPLIVYDPDQVDIDIKGYKDLWDESLKDSVAIIGNYRVIAGITQNPTDYDPVTRPENNKIRRNKVLKNMLEQGYISQKQYDKAMSDDVYARIQATSASSQADNAYSYFVDALAQQVIQDLKDQLGYTDTQAYNAVYSGGLSIYSTQNQEMQKICDEEANNDANYPGLKEYGLDYALTVTRADGSVENYGSNNIKNYVEKTYGNDQGLLYSSEDAAKAMVAEWKSTIAQEGDTYDERITITPQPQSSITIMDQKTGQIKAMVGGRGEKASSLGLNRAYQGSKRQPGSTFKILAAYAPALDSCDKTLATTIDDEPYTLKNGNVLRNANKQYGGTTTLRNGIKKSINVVAVKLSDEITQELGYEYCEKFGISTLVKDKTINGKVFDDSTSQTLALGGITEGVYNYEMCAAYASIANGGVYNKPTLYSKVVDHDGNVLLDGTGESHTVIKDSTAYLLTSAMEDVVNSGTGTACQLPNMPVAGKTGTTTSNKDLWFCGFTPYYTCAVWGGYDDNKECDYDTSFRFRLWKGIMSRIHENLESKDFKVPTSVEKKSICTITGKLATNGCPSITEYFAKDTLPSETCSGHGYSSGRKYKSSTEDNDTTEDASSYSNNTGNSYNNNTGTTSDNTGGNTGGSTGGNTGGSTGGNTGGSTSGNTGGGSTGGNTGGGSTGGNTGGSTGGDTSQ